MIGKQIEVAIYNRVISLSTMFKTLPGHRIYELYFSSYSQQLLHATSRKVMGTIPDEVIGFFNLSNPYCRTIALESTKYQESS
jgi:hypothetical protein